MEANSWPSAVITAPLSIQWLTQGGTNGDWQLSASVTRERVLGSALGKALPLVIASVSQHPTSDRKNRRIPATHRDATPGANQLKRHPSSTPKTEQHMGPTKHALLYRVFQNECPGFNNLTNTIHFRQRYMYFFIWPFGAGIIFFNFSTPVYKMWIIQEPNTLELWNKLHFEEKKNGEYVPCLKYSVPIFVE